MGLQRKFLGDVVVLPTFYLGLVVPEPYVESGISQIITFINNMESKNSYQILLRIHYNCYR